MGDTALPLPRVHLVRWKVLLVMLTVCATVVIMCASVELVPRYPLSGTLQLLEISTVVVTAMLGWQLARGAPVPPAAMLSLAVFPVVATHLLSWREAVNRVDSWYWSAPPFAGERSIAFLTTTVNLTLVVVSIASYFATIDTSTLPFFQAQPCREAIGTAGFFSQSTYVLSAAMALRIF